MATIQLPDGINIRHAAETDTEAFRNLRLEALKEHPIAFGQDYDENILRPQSYWESVLKTNDQEQALYFAEYNGQLIGMTGIYRRLSRKNMHSAGIWGVYVQSEWRGRHIAEALINSCLLWARQLNIVIAKLAVTATNQPAIHCYKRCGFSIYGKEPQAIYYDGTYYEEYLMSIELV